MLLSHRKEFPLLIEERRYSIAAEVGVASAEFSVRLVGATTLKRLVLIDVWAAECDAENERAARAFSAAQPITEIIKRPSVEVAGSFPDALFDFVYIDADHSRDSVLADAQAWWPKVRDGGCLAGHDYALYNHIVGCPTGVLLATEEFAAEVGHKLYVTGADQPTYLSRLRAATAAVHAPSSRWGDDIPSWYMFKGDTR